MKAKLIALDGLDCCFKETNSKVINDFLLSKGYLSTIVSFPRYNKPSSYYISNYLKGDYNPNPISINPITASLFYLLDFYDFFTNIENKYILDQYDFIVLDRYTLANKIYQSAKISDILKKEEYFSWLADMENNVLNLPKVDLGIYMNLSYELSKSFREDKASDIHETSDSYIKKVYENALSISFRNDYINVPLYTETINRDGVIQYSTVNSREEIASTIIAVVSTIFNI